MSIELLIADKVPANIVVKVNETRGIEEGLVVVYPIWSADRGFLDILLAALKATPVPCLHIIDIDHESCREFEQRFHVLPQGRCEMYAIREAAIKFSIARHDEKRPENLIRSLLEAVNS